MDSERKAFNPPRDAVFACYPVEVPLHDDEIRLVDLWLVLVRRKGVFFAVAGMILALGLAYALLAPPKYRYSALIELGSIPTEDGPEPVEAASTALAKVKEAFLPAELTEYLKTRPEGAGGPPKIRASIPKGSETLILEAEGPIDKGPTTMGIEQGVIARLARDHADFTLVARQSIRANITAARSKVETLATNNEMLAARAKRLEELAATLRGKREGTQQNLDEAVALEKKLAGGDAGALLQANVEARVLREQLSALDERLAADLPEQYDDVRAAIDENAREMAVEQERIPDLEARLASVRDTRAIQPPTRSFEKVGPGRTVIVLLAAMLGMFLGILSAFGVELVGKVRRELAESGPKTKSNSADG